MVVLTNPFCPVSFGFLGFLGAVLSRRGFLYRSKPDQESEEADMLLTNDGGECHELSEDRISKFLESQKADYYKSIGMQALPESLPVEGIPSVPSSPETFAIDKDEPKDCPTASSTPALIDCLSEVSDDQDILNPRKESSECDEPDSALVESAQ